MEFELDFPLDGFSTFDELFSHDNCDNFPFLGVDSDLETVMTEQEAEKMEGIEAQDLSSLLEQFEEASQSLDGIDLSRDSSTFQKSKSLPASRVSSATNSPAHTPPATPPPCMLDKIRARHADNAKRKSTIMLPMGAPPRHSRGKATTLDVSSTSPGSSKLQKILSRKSLQESPLTQSPMLLAELQKTSGPSSVVHSTFRQGTPGAVVQKEPVLHPPNGVSNPVVVAKGLNASGLQKSLMLSSAGVNGVQKVVPSPASCVSVPVTFFSSQPMVVGNNIAHPLPLILSTVGPSGSQQDIPVQFVMTSSAPPAGSIVIDARSSSLQVSRPAQKLVSSSQAPANNRSLALNPAVNAATSTVIGATDCVHKGVKAGVKPPPLQTKKLPRTHYTTVSTRAEGIPLHVLDSVMDHDYCANSPRRVIVDEFELDLSPTKTVHKVMSLPIIEAGGTWASREIDMGSNPNSNTRDSTSTQSLPDIVSRMNSTSGCVRKGVERAVSAATLDRDRPTHKFEPGLSLPSTTAISAVTPPHQAVLDIPSGAQTSRAWGMSTADQTSLHLPACVPRQETVPPLVQLQPSNVVQASRVFQTASKVKSASRVQTHHLLSNFISKPKVIKPVDACSIDDQTKVLSVSQAAPSVVKSALLQKDSLTDKTLKDMNLVTNGETESVVFEKQAKSVSVGSTMLTDAEQKGQEYNTCFNLSDGRPPPLLSMPVFTAEEAVSGTVSSETKIKPKSQDVTSSGILTLTSSENETGDSDSRLSLRGREETSQDANDQVPTAPSTSSSDEMLDFAIVPHSPGHVHDDPAVGASDSAQFSGQFDPIHCASQPLEEHEMYTEEDLAEADRDRFIRFAEEERQEKEAVLQSRRRGSGRGNKKSGRSHRWRPGNSPVKEDSSSFFNKIPSYYTALHTPKITGRKQLTAEALQGMTISDFIPQDQSPTRDGVSTYSKLPAYHSCFTNSTKYDAAAEDNSFHGSEYDGSKPKYSFSGTLDSASRSKSRSRSRSRERSSSRGRSRKRVRSASSSDSSRSRSRSQHRQGRKRSLSSRSSVSGSSRSSSSRSSSSSSSSGSQSRSKGGRSSEDLTFKRRQKQKDKIRKMEERKIVYVGRIPENYTRKDLRKRFERYGQIEAVSVHFREAGDNYGFVTYFYTCDAYTAIDKGNDNPNDLQFDLCFGGRRHFCSNNYADLDGNMVIDEEYTPLPAKDPGGFDELLKQFKQNRNKKW